jgi:uncharacterized protein HemY
MKRFIFLLLPTLASTLASAHEGHGIEGASHYHATDVWGFVALAIVAAVVWWFSGRNK